MTNKFDYSWRRKILSFASRQEKKGYSRLDPDPVNLILPHIKIEESKGPPTLLAQGSIPPSHPETAKIIEKRLPALTPQGRVEHIRTGTRAEWR